MGLESARRALVRALKGGDYQHEARDVLSEKNLLAIGSITEAEVILLLQRTHGSQYSTSPHDSDQTVEVHVFKPVVKGLRWYVKAYFLDGLDGTAVFISVHR